MTASSSFGIEGNCRVCIRSPHASFRDTVTGTTLCSALIQLLYLKLCSCFCCLCVCVSAVCRVWTVRYNPSHDQFVVSAGSDTAVKLWSAVSVSSAHKDAEEYTGCALTNAFSLRTIAAVVPIAPRTVPIRSFDHHERAYMATVPATRILKPYDGRVSINHAEHRQAKCGHRGV